MAKPHNIHLDPRLVLLDGEHQGIVGTSDSYRTLAAMSDASGTYHITTWAAGNQIPEPVSIGNVVWGYTSYRVYVPTLDEHKIVWLPASTTSMSEYIAAIKRFDDKINDMRLTNLRQLRG